jgi:hypothetical protein
LRNTSGEEAGIAETTLDEIALKIMSHALQEAAGRNPHPRALNRWGPIIALARIGTRRPLKNNQRS